MTQALLQDRRVLVVEDEYVIAEAMCRGLRQAGATVLGPVSNVTAALALLAAVDQVDAAVLDINLGEQKVYPVVDVLVSRGARCVFATGNDPADVPQAYAAMTRCEKPVDTRCLVQALSENSSPALLEGSDRRASALTSLRNQLIQQLRTVDQFGETLIAVKLCEALDAVDDVLLR